MSEECIQNITTINHFYPTIKRQLWSQNRLSQGPHYRKVCLGTPCDEHDA